MPIYGDAENAEDFGQDAEITQTFDVKWASDWNNALSAIKNGGNNKNYIINITHYIPTSGSTANTFGALTGLTVSIRGDYSISLSTKGSVLRIEEGQTIIVRDTDFNGISMGYDEIFNDEPLIYLASGALTLRGSVSVRLNDNSGGVYVAGGAFTMEDNASVSDNSFGWDGGGVYVAGGTFTMEDSASVYDNYDSFVSRHNGGGGVYVNGGTFIMKDNASISGNHTSYGTNGGGGVYVADGIFQIAGGTIYGKNEGDNSNSAAGSGAALYKNTSGISQYGIFDGDVFTSKGNLSTTDNTITVVNGELQ